MDEPKGPTRDWRFRPDARKRNREDEDDQRQEQRPRDIRSFPSSNESKDCYHYLETGWCRLGRNCRFNHPKEIRQTDGRVVQIQNRLPWRRSNPRYERELRSWDENWGNIREHSPRDAETQRRSDESEERYLQHKNWGNIREHGPRDAETQWRSDESEERYLRYKNRDWGGNIREHSLRDAETQRRSDESEERYLQHKNRDWGWNESEWRADDRRQSEYLSPPSQRDSSYYQRAGICKHFMRGTCDYGSACNFFHPKDRHGAEPTLSDVRGLPMRQDRNTDWRARESDWRFDKRRHETELSYNPMGRDSPEHRAISSDRRASGRYDERRRYEADSSSRPEKRIKRTVHFDDTRRDRDRLP